MYHNFTRVLKRLCLSMAALLACWAIWSASDPQRSFSGTGERTTPAATAPRVGEKPAAPQDPVIGSTISGFKLVRTDDTLFQMADQKQQVLIVAFVGVECPLANLYFPRLNELAEQFKNQSVGILAINSNAQDSLPQLRAQVFRHKAMFPVLKDAGNRVADLFQASRTPEAFVLDAARKVCYRGPIDDQYGYRVRRQSPGRTYVVDAVTAVLAGQPVQTTTVAVEGCHIGRKPAPRADAPAPQLSARVTWYRDVLPIVQTHCQECHRAGEIGPFALKDYDEVSNWAETIKEVVLEKRMPPWTADPAHGEFINDPSLTPEEVNTLVAWVDNGAPAGDPATAPAERQFHDGWNIGQPDAIFSMPRSFKIKSNGNVSYQYFVVSEVFTEDKWVQAVECRPGNRAVVHHILALLDTPGKRRSRQNGLDRGFFAASAPGSSHVIFPEGQAKRIPAGSQIVFQVHYTPNGTEQEDLSSMGVVFAKGPPRQEVHTYGLAYPHFLIRAGEADHVETHSIRLPADLEVTTLFPHLHLRGKSFEYRVEFPDGRKQVLLSVPRWDFNWQQHFRFKQPVFLPRGAKLTITAHWDNSADNPNNIFPLTDVHWGDQTWEEMFIGYADYVTPLPAARDTGAGG